MAKRVDMRMKLPPRIKNFIEMSVELGVYPDAGACVTSLFDRTEGPHTNADLEAMVERAMRSGKTRGADESFWAEMHEFAHKAADLSRKRKGTRRKVA